MPSLIRDSANELPDELGIRLFSYYLFVNSTFNVITSLAAANLCSENLLWQTLIQWLKQQAAGQPRDSSAIHYLLNSPKLYAKNNLLCCLRALNENTLGDLASIYHSMPNPLIRQRGSEPAPQTTLHLSTPSTHKDTVVHDLHTFTH
jgi:N2-citryl-N6-acetyl-N6-hydroxylysine synthase